MNDPEPSHRRLFQIIELTKQGDRARASWAEFNRTVGEHGRSSPAALCAVFGIAFGAFHFAKADFFAAPVVGAVIGLCVGWCIGKGISLAWHFLTSTLPHLVVTLCKRVFKG